MRTDFTTLLALATHTINHLKQDHYIEYGADKRSDLIDSMATELGVSFSTDEDIRDQAIEEVEEKFGVDAVTDEVTETEMFNHARKEIIKAFQGENLGGLYMVESLNHVANRIKDFVLTNDLVEEVFHTDEEIVEYLVSALRKFSNR